MQIKMNPKIVIHSDNHSRPKRYRNLDVFMWGFLSKNGTLMKIIIMITYV